MIFTNPCQSHFWEVVYDLRLLSKRVFPSTSVVPRSSWMLQSSPKAFQNSKTASTLFQNTSKRSWMMRGYHPKRFWTRIPWKSDLGMGSVRHKYWCWWGHCRKKMIFTIPCHKYSWDTFPGLWLASKTVLHSILGVPNSSRALQASWKTYQGDCKPIPKRLKTLLDNTRMSFQEVVDAHTLTIWLSNAMKRSSDSQKY